MSGKITTPFFVNIYGKFFFFSFELISIVKKIRKLSAKKGFVEKTVSFEEPRQLRGLSGDSLLQL